MHRRVVADVVHDRASAVCPGQVSSMAALDDAFAAKEKTRSGKASRRRFLFAFDRMRSQVVMVRSVVEKGG
jgi:hypothetical protein